MVGEAGGLGVEEATGASSILVYLMKRFSACTAHRATLPATQVPVVLRVIECPRNPCPPSLCLLCPDPQEPAS